LGYTPLISVFGVRNPDPAVLRDPSKIFNVLRLLRKKDKGVLWTGPDDVIDLIPPDLIRAFTPEVGYAANEYPRRLLKSYGLH
jgi:translation initiation factor 2B subunit (eIF-2B alpha/beta/delta family)